MFKSFPYPCFVPAQLFAGGYAGFLPAVYDPAYVLQTAGGSQATAAGDPIGQWLPRAGTLTLAQATSGNRGTRARWPASGIKNLLTYSAALDNAVWTKTRATVSTDATTAPDGTSTADKLVEDSTAANNHYTYQLLTIATTTAYTWSVYVKAAGRTWVGLSAYDGSTRLTFFNLSNGSVGTSAAGNTAAIVDAGNGWYRCSITRTTAATTIGAIEVYIAEADNDITFNGDGASGLYVWGAQIERSSALSAYQTVVSAADITESGQPDRWGTLWDGTSDYGDFGVQSFGNASLFAAAGQAWTVWGAHRAVASGSLNYGIFAKASATAGNRQLFLQVNTSGTYNCYVRGTLNVIGKTSGDNIFHCWALRWNGSSLLFYYDRDAPTALTVGSAAEESENIIVAARTASSPTGFYAGHNDVAMIDRALTDAEINQLMSNLNAYYRPGL